jgi:hypothetical protein
MQVFFDATHENRSYASIEAHPSIDNLQPANRYLRCFSN